jgi:hypothetical protein
VRIAALLLMVAITRNAAGQSTAELPVKPELQLDVTRIANRYAVQAGGGVQIPIGYYARVGVIGVAGADVEQFRQDASGRLDILGRFLFDPFRQQRWGLSAGGGVSLRARSRERVRPYLVSVIDLEGPRGTHGFSPAFQVGLGGGIRVGASLRWGVAGSR